MKILILLKETASTEEDIRIKNKKIKKVINPYDEYALQQASKLKEKFGAEITTLMLNETDDLYTLKTSLGLGADKGILVKYSSNNPKNIVEILAKEISTIEYDYIFTGVKDVNDTRAEVPSRLACKIDIPILNHVIGLEIDDEDIIFKKESENYIESTIVEKPAIISFSKNVYEPKYPTISDILEIKNKPIIVKIEDEKKYKDLNLKVLISDSNRKRIIFNKLASAKDGAEKINEYLNLWVTGE